MKSEPDAYSIDDLKRDKQEPWDGIRNYQARNFMRDTMQVGDLVLFYHSNAKPPGVVGLAQIASEPYPDALAFDPKSKYYAPKSNEADPTWILVDVGFIEKFDGIVSLDDMKASDDLEEMLVVRKGQRLSIQPVDKKHFKIVCKMAKAKTKV